MAKTQGHAGSHEARGIRIGPRSLESDREFAAAQNSGLE